MMPATFFRRTALIGWWPLLLALHSLTAVERPTDSPEDAVTYEAFGAVGDGVADDLPAIVAAHAHANARNLPVRSKPAATYHLGRQALTAIIETDTDWNTSQFIIDDSQGVDDHRRALFEVRSRLEPVPLKFERLSAGQTQLDLRPATDLFVLVRNDDRRVFIRRGLNANRGTPQQEVFILRKDGSIEGAIEWDYDVVTHVEARPIDPQPLVVRGGVFRNIANRMVQELGYNYWGRNLVVRRSNTELDGITHRVTGETEVGHPYRGFLSVEQCANITLRNCTIDARKVYKTIGAAGEPVSMGTYGYSANRVVNYRMIGCRMDDIHDVTRWGVAGTNFMKNILLEDCVLSRMDVHMGVSGYYIIRRTELGHAGLNAIGRGRLLVEDSTVHSGSLISFRSDYGSTWDGEVEVRNSRWVPPVRAGRTLAMFRMSNDGTHDFGYPCSMPRVVRIDGLVVEDSGRGEAYEGITYFGDPLGAPREERPFPYRLTEKVEVRGLKTASGIVPRVSANRALADAITLTSMP
jgi:hypothetical protein